MEVVVGEVADGCWSNNGELANAAQRREGKPLPYRFTRRFFGREYLRGATEPYSNSIVYRGAGIAQEGPSCLKKGMVERHFWRICGGTRDTRCGHFGVTRGLRRLRF